MENEEINRNGNNGEINGGDEEEVAAPPPQQLTQDEPAMEGGVPEIELIIKVILT